MATLCEAGRLTAVCLASGPSLTKDDCEKVRHLPTVVCNLTFRTAPWADVLVAHDSRWWRHYGAEAKESFNGRRIGSTYVAKDCGAEWNRSFLWFDNTGCAAISLAVREGAKRVLLLGYDCQQTGGRWHHHEDYSGHITNCRSMKYWPDRFAKVAKYAAKSGVEVINCSRETALTCFDRRPLEECL